MNVSKWKYLLALAVVSVLVGIAGNHFLNQSVARTAQAPAQRSEMQDKQNAVAWKRTERPVRTVNSRFKLNLPVFPPDADWIVGVKPIKEGEKERMYVGIVTWEDAIDKEGKARGLGGKNVSKMEDYPQEAASFADGETSVANILADNQTLVIYLEVAPSTKIVVAQNGKESVLKASEGSAVIFDGKKESVKLEGPAFLLNEMHIKKLKKEAEKAGHSVKLERKETNR
jgi:hypothetical protein